MQVLLLNLSYEPLKVISWQKAVILMFKKKATVIEEYDHHFLHSEKLTMRMPAVLRLHYYVNARNYHHLRFSKDNIFFRDNYTCLYCGNKFSKSDLTLDHVIPYSKGGKKTWNNIVTACHPCNNKKADREPSQEDLKLLKYPIQPLAQTHLAFYAKLQNIPEKWENYLPIKKKELIST